MKSHYVKLHYREEPHKWLCTSGNVCLVITLKNALNVIPISFNMALKGQLQDHQGDITW